jgi:uncharacterized protein YbjQ (UPF0145 family)
MVFRAMVLKAVKGVIFPVLEEILDNQVKVIKEEISEVEELSDEGKEAAYKAVDRLVERFKSLFANAV